MKSIDELRARELAQRLAEAEATIQALLSGQIDAVVDPASHTPVLLAKAQEALRDSEDRLRQERDRAKHYLDTATVILLALDLDGKITLVNRYACSILGWPCEALLGRDWVKTCLPRRTQQAVRAKLQRLIEGDVSIVENPVLTASGEERLIEWRNTVSRDDAGRVTGTFSSGTDITDRHRAEEARRASEGRYRALFDNAPDGILVADRESVYLDANASICTMLGYSRTELIGLHASDIVSPSEVRHIGPALDLITSFSDYHREWQFRRKDGTVFMADVIATVMPDGDLLAMIRDVTERNRANEALRTAEESTRFALEAAGVGTWDMDYTTGVLRWSETSEAMYGLAPGIFDGTFESFVKLIHPDDREAMIATFSQAMAEGSDFTVQHRVLWPDGTVRWLAAAGRVRLGANGEPERAVGISQDFTERRTLEDQYRQAQKMEAVGRLASGVAHDFNNLLTVILGFTQFVADDDTLSGKHATDLAEVIRAAQSASSLTTQLLAFSRQQLLHAAPLDVNGLITDMTGMLGRLIGEDVAVSLSLAPALHLALADRGQIQQVVMNLVVNARDAMPGGGKVTIATKDVELESSDFHQEAVVPGPYVMLAITDTGSGMTKEVQRRLFEPFFTTKEKGKGTGLGLSTTYGIVRQSSGYIWVYSEPGEGTTFKVYLPRAGEGVVAAATLAAAAPVTQASETVLLVEDEAGVRQLAKRILEKAGYRVLEASNGDHAERVFAENRDAIALVITDVVMPGCGGPELLTRLQVHVPDLRVLYMSGYTEQAAAHRAGIDQGLPFVQKPFTAAEFARQVRDALDR